VTPEVRPTTVFLVDDDAAVLTALSRLLRAKGHVVQAFESAEALLEHWNPESPGCLVLDVALPGLNGLALQRRLAEAGHALSIVFLTANGDIPMTVEAIKAGAVDFLTKPVKAEALLDAVQRALAQDALARDVQAGTEVLKERLATLTPREVEVLEQLVAGKLNKQAAADLGIVERTVKFHRARIMERMRASSFAELVLMASKLGIGPTRPTER
jgi:FixJ family two-component response regulator